MRGFIGMCLLFSLSMGARASTAKCEDLVQDLQAMRAAQQQLLRSLTHQNQTMATVLDQNAQKLEKSIADRRAIRKSDLSSLHLSAKAFRGYDKKETALIEKFQKASDELLAQVQSCLSHSSATVATAAKN